ncbi:zinc-dependent alcohol dehydrogenase family protein [uncultured Tateyamaria sp.]|uniref:zinc-dependent alcohol dehydrogenase family protein n=1 Tax=uncultured Tateyamaria sp. TaxID=455651 RepID=UPI00261BC61D|nr:zinc-dependent alcohol dehydrogenase family protein [uncultured Tateyamaria sp.]
MPLTAQFDTLGGPEKIKLVDVPGQPPAADEVQLRMRVAGLNRAELLYVAGHYLVEPPIPNAPLGAEGAGEIISVGSGVTDFAEGDRVCVLPMIDWAKYGTLAEIVNVPAYALERIPEGISFEDAAAFWMAYTTAYGMIVQAGEMPLNAAGRTVLITGASSSVGTAAFQILKQIGATSIGTTRTQKKVDDLNKAGADHVIVTDDEDIGARLKEITNGKGVDLVCDSVIGDMIAPAAEALVPEGNMVLMGFQSGEIPGLPFYPILTKGITIRGFHLVWHLLDHADRRRRAVDFLSPLWASGELKPVIDRVFPLSDVSGAYAYMATNNHLGKIVIQIL